MNPELRKKVNARGNRFYKTLTPEEQRGVLRYIEFVSMQDSLVKAHMPEYLRRRIRNWMRRNPTKQ